MLIFYIFIILDLTFYIVFKIIEMFPYPSGKLHIGHLRNYYIGEVNYRCRKLMGEKVSRYMGFDSMGLPAENAALRNRIKPLLWTEKNINEMISDLKNWGFSFDLDGYVMCTHKVEYQISNAKLFLELFKNGFIYETQKRSFWDPVDQTVLAREQIINGKGWRSGANVTVKSVWSLAFRVSKCIEDIYNNLPNLNWPNYIVNPQKEWINRHYVETGLIHIDGNEYKCSVLEHDSKSAYVSFNHHSVKDSEIDASLLFSNKVSKLPKQAIFNGNQIDVYIDYRLSESYGYGCIVANTRSSLSTKPTEKFKDKLFGVHDWELTRQRLWGSFIPLGKCECKGKIHMIEDTKTMEKAVMHRQSKVTYNDLVADPYIVSNCQNCRSKIFVIPESLDTFFDSTWYFSKYESAKSYEWKVKSENVNLYIGGAEHATLHLLYLQYVWNAILKISGHKCIIESIVSQGMIYGATYKDANGMFVSPNKSGAKYYKNTKLSKSHFNAPDLNEYLKKYSRCAILISTVMDKPVTSTYAWSEEMFNKAQKLIDKWLDYIQNFNSSNSSKEALNQVFKYVKSNKINMAIATVNKCIKNEEGIKNLIKVFIK